MSKRECADAESAAKHLKELLSGTDILKEICTIRKGQRIATVNKQIEAYGFKAVDDNNRLQTGQLWLLTGRNGDAIKALNAGQSLDIRSEIEYDVGVMYGSISGKKVNWICREGHKWPAVISSRAKINGAGCRFCAGRKK